MSNLEAAEATIARMRQSGVLEDVDEATVQAVLSLAAAVDDPAARADMWREYRAALTALKEAAAGGSDDDTAAFLVSIQTPRGTKVGNPKKS